MPSGGSGLGAFGKAVAGGAMMAGGHALMNKMSGSNSSPADMSPVSSGGGAEMASGVAEDASGTGTDGFDKLEGSDAPLGLPDKSSDTASGGGSPDVSTDPLNPDDGSGGAVKSLEEQFDNPNVTSLGDMSPSGNGTGTAPETLDTGNASKESRSGDTKEAVKHGAAAGVHGASAYAKGASGDAVGAAKSGKKALDEAGKAKGSLDKGESAGNTSNNAQTSVSHDTTNTGGSVNNSTSKNISGGHNSKSSTLSSSSSNSSNKTSVANAGSNAVNNSKADTRVAGASVNSSANSLVNSKSDSFENNSKVVNDTDNGNSHEATSSVRAADVRPNANANTNVRADADAIISHDNYGNVDRIKSFGVFANQQGAAVFTNSDQRMSVGVAINKQEVRKVLSSNKFKAAAVGGVAAGVMISSSKRKKLEEKKKEKKSDYNCDKILLSNTRRLLDVVDGVYS